MQSFDSLFHKYFKALFIDISLEMTSFDYRILEEAKEIADTAMVSIYDGDAKVLQGVEFEAIKYVVDMNGWRIYFSDAADNAEMMLAVVRFITNEKSPMAFCTPCVDGVSRQDMMRSAIARLAIIQVCIACAQYHFTVGVLIAGQDNTVYIH